LCQAIRYRWPETSLLRTAASMNYVSALQELLALKHSDALSPPLLQSITTSLTALPPNLIQQLLQILLTAQFARASHYDLFRALVTGCAGRLIADARFYGGGFRASRRSARFLDLLFASLERQRSLTAVNLASAAVMGLEVCKDQPSVKASFRVKYGRKAIDVWTRAHEDIEVTGWMAAQAFPALPLETFAGSDVSVRLSRRAALANLTLLSDPSGPPHPLAQPDTAGRHAIRRLASRSCYNGRWDDLECTERCWRMVLSDLRLDNFRVRDPSAPSDGAPLVPQFGSTV
jgi:hypothetical protein